MTDNVIATLLTKDEYYQGIYNLHYTYKLRGLKTDFLCMITDNVGQETIDKFIQAQIPYKIVKYYTFNSRDNIRFQDTINKFHVWELTDYKKAMFLDGDTLICKQTVDDLFDTVNDDFNGTLYSNDGMPIPIHSIEGICFIVKPNLEKAKEFFTDEIINTFTTDEEVLNFKYLDGPYCNNFKHYNQHNDTKIFHFSGYPKYWQYFTDCLKWDKVLKRLWRHTDFGILTRFQKIYLKLIDM